jgi:uncharacterized membrane protein
MLFTVILFVCLFPLTLAHMRARRIPLTSWGTMTAFFLLGIGLISFVLLVIGVVVIAVVIETMVFLMSPEDREQMATRFIAENQASDDQIDEVQRGYDRFACVVTYTAEQDYDYRQALRRLDAENIWYFVRGGLITSILVKPDDGVRAAALLGIAEVEAVADEIPTSA